MRFEVWKLSTKKLLYLWSLNKAHVLQVYKRGEDDSNSKLQKSSQWMGPSELFVRWKTYKLDFVSWTPWLQEFFFKSFIYLKNLDFVEMGLFLWGQEVSQWNTCSLCHLWGRLCLPLLLGEEVSQVFIHNIFEIVKIPTVANKIHELALRKY